jgi:hypothetical protein
MYVMYNPVGYYHNTINKVVRYFLDIEGFKLLVTIDLSLESPLTAN